MFIHENPLKEKEGACLRFQRGRKTRKSSACLVGIARGVDGLFSWNI